MIRLQDAAGRSGQAAGGGLRRAALAAAVASSLIALAIPGGPAVAGNAMPGNTMPGGVTAVDWNGGWQQQGNGGWRQQGGGPNGGYYAPAPPRGYGGYPGWRRPGWQRYGEICRMRRQQVVLRQPYGPPVLAWQPVRVCWPVR